MKQMSGWILFVPLLASAASVTPPAGAVSSYASAPAPVVWQVRTVTAAVQPAAVDAVTKTVSVTPNVCPLDTSRPGVVIIIR